jgi:hypothetical protein
MTEPQARRIAEAAITLRDARNDLLTHEQQGHRQESRDGRRAVAAAQAQLDAAIDEAVER